MKVVKLLCVVLVGCLALLTGLLLPRKSPVVLQEPERTFFVSCTGGCQLPGPDCGGPGVP